MHKKAKEQRQVVYEVLSLSEAERLLGLRPRRLHNYIRRGKMLPGEVRKTGKQWQITIDALNRLIRQRIIP